MLKLCDCYSGENPSSEKYDTGQFHCNSHLFGKIWEEAHHSRTTTNTQPQKRYEISDKMFVTPKKNFSNPIFDYHTQSYVITSTSFYEEYFFVGSRAQLKSQSILSSNFSFLTWCYSCFKKASLCNTYRCQRKKTLHTFLYVCHHLISLSTEYTLSIHEESNAGTKG